MSLLTVVNPLELSEYLLALERTFALKVDTVKVQLDSAIIEGVEYDDTELRDRIESLEMMISGISASVTSLLASVTSLTSSIAACETISDHNADLADYETTAAHSASIANFVTNASLATTLGSYETTSAHNTSIALYETISAHNAGIATCVPSSTYNTFVASQATTNTSVSSSITSLGSMITAIQQAATSWISIELTPIDHNILTISYARTFSHVTDTQLDPGGTQDVTASVLTVTTSSDFAQQDALNLKLNVNALIQITCLLCVTHNNGSFTPMEWIVRLKRYRSASWTTLSTIESRTTSGASTPLNFAIMAISNAQTNDQYAIWMENNSSAGTDVLWMQSYVMFARRLN